ncbi:Fe-S cluster domain protein [Desulfosarcina cetonica]|uniref:(Fe-S)-binding protein n=1 Tax=Desulfosarcina cetonica TaxID=90730 RepID=UPI0006D1DF14|nr:(Fe-S)-binding protein [Desulfosarcina cetonica]VTR65826.1 Fe-S cluster domain protein [Desulfosarcina cetonica]
MLLDSYRIEIFNNKCMPGAMSVQCFAHLDQDVSEALPYLNAEWGGFEYIKDPPSVTFKIHGKLLTVHGRKIAVNANKNEDEVRKIIEWVKREINRVWENRAAITPRYEGMPRPQLIRILKCLPKTNCRQCGEPTCMVFATRVADGVKGSADCPPLTPKAKTELDAYMKPFAMDAEGTIPW